MRLDKIVSFAALALLLTGCADWERHVQSTLPTPQPALADKQIVVAPGRSVQVVQFEGKSTTLTAEQKADLAAFLDEALRNDMKVVVGVEDPGKKAPRAERQRAANLATTIRRMGWSTKAVTLDVPGAEGSVRIVVDHLIAVAPKCPDWDFHKYHNFSSQPYPNYGCADRSNLAAMIANPRDLVTGEVPSGWRGPAALAGEARYRNGQAIAPVGTEVATGAAAPIMVGGGL